MMVEHDIFIYYTSVCVCVQMLTHLQLLIGSRLVSLHHNRQLVPSLSQERKEIQLLKDAHLLIEWWHSWNKATSDEHTLTRDVWLSSSFCFGLFISTARSWYNFFTSTTYGWKQAKKLVVTISTGCWQLMYHTLKEFYSNEHTMLHITYNSIKHSACSPSVQVNGNIMMVTNSEITWTRSWRWYSVHGLLVTMVFSLFSYLYEYLWVDVRHLGSSVLTSFV